MSAIVRERRRTGGCEGHRRARAVRAVGLLRTVDTTGVRMLSLRVTDGGDGRNFDHADWAEAR
ncbi:NPCBM/NEW2 domain-containing protein [Amycolatopsis sp. lyj-112]|uniref:NPCBM/NEW2 domain-containing protein n=1 Tax=Amycolatopsis sp. lyj-112 TaxID=2789288 RepID=UPI00397AD87B